MKSIDDFNNENAENLEDESVDNINQIPVVKSKDVQNEYAEKEVKVLFYNKDSKMIVFDFDDAKIQMPFDGKVDVTKGIVIVEYRGTVGETDFEVKMKQN